MPKANRKQINIPESEVLTRKEAAVWLKCGLSTLDIIPKETLPRVRYGKSVRYRLADLRKYIDEHICGGPTDGK